MLIQKLGTEGSRVLYQGHSYGEALLAALSRGLTLSQAVGDTTSFATMYGDRQREVATLTREGRVYVLRTTDFSDPTKEELEAFGRSAHLDWLISITERTRKNPVPLEFKASIGDIVLCELKDGSKLVGYVSELKPGKIQFTDIDITKKDRAPFWSVRDTNQLSTIGTYNLDDIVGYTQLEVDNTTKPELRLGAPVMVTKTYAGFTRDFPLTLVGFISKLGLEGISLNPFEPPKKYEYFMDYYTFDPNALKKLVNKDSV